MQIDQLSIESSEGENKEVFMIEESENEDQEEEKQPNDLRVKSKSEKKSLDKAKSLVPP